MAPFVFSALPIGVGCRSLGRDARLQDKQPPLAKPKSAPRNRGTNLVLEPPMAKKKSRTNTPPQPSRAAAIAAQWLPVFVRVGLALWDHFKPR